MEASGTYKSTSETVETAELGRRKYASTPQEHLLWLLGIGWSPDSPLIRKYVAKKNLYKELEEWNLMHMPGQ